jgi:hypothetical protein
LATRAYDLARAGQLELARASADRASDFCPKEPYIAGVYWLAIARTYGLIAARLESQSQGSSKEHAELQRCVAGAKEALRKCFEAVPGLSGLAAHESELRSVR